MSSETLPGGPDGRSATTTEPAPATSPAPPATSGFAAAEARPAPNAVPGAWPRREPPYGALIRKTQHGDPVGLRLARVARRWRGVVAPADVSTLVAAIRLPLRHPLRLAVTSVRGGAGTTTVSALIATTLARHRPDRIFVVDADPGLGSLALRLGVTPARSLRELVVANPPSPTAFEQLSPYLTRCANDMWLLAGAVEEPTGPLLDPTHYRDVAEHDRFFAVTVVDCGEGLLGAVTREVLQGAHAQLLVTPATVDGALSARRGLSWLARNGYSRLLSRTIVVLADHTRSPRIDVERATQLFGTYGVGVCRLPYDRHLESGAMIDPALLGERVRRTVLRLAADLLRRAAR